MDPYTDLPDSPEFPSLDEVLKDMEALEDSLLIDTAIATLPTFPK